MKTGHRVPPVVPMDPRIRRRRIEVRRDEGRRRLRILLAALAILALTLAGWLATRSPFLDIDHIRVQGAAHTARADILAAARLAHGEPMVDLDLEGAVRRVEALPWVAGARVRRIWPSAVVITVTERRPTALTSTNSPDAEPWAVLDAAARVLEVTSIPPPGLILLEGVGPIPAPGATVPSAQAPLVVVAALSPSLAARTSAVVAAQDGQVDLKLKPRGTVRFGVPESLDAKVRAAESVLASVDVRNLAVLDVRLPASPVLTRG